MDFQSIVDSFSAMTCVISVEKKKNGSYGAIRIVTGNKAYIQSVEGSPDMPQLATNKFIPNSEYQIYFPKDLNFEDFCYRSAVLKQPLHSYVHPERFDFWFNLFFMPLESDDENIAYCTYTQEITKEANTEKMSNTSYETASEVLKTCIKLRGTSDFQKTMGDVVNDIRELCHAQFCCLMLIDFITCKCTLLGESMKGMTEHRTTDEWLSANFYDLAITWHDTIGGSNCLIIKNKNDMNFLKQKNKKWYDSLQKNSVESIVLFPLRANDELMGYMWVTNFDTEHTVKIKETLELTTFFLSSEIASHLLFEKFRILSSIDMLTGVLNRNEMNNRVDSLSNPKQEKKTSVGVVFADLNNLKTTNDLLGHEAGDRLLKNAADILRHIFPDDEIYRAGGDEFMVMVIGKTQSHFEKKIERLRAEIENNETSFAIGSSFERDGRNVRAAMKTADALMYEDKKLYYKKHPEKKHR
ncbi:MAG: GGDEF domain-containing protein [Treponema sp.]|nr:GGDEF domain-containing protein [Treponema sp.]